MMYRLTLIFSLDLLTEYDLVSLQWSATIDTYSYLAWSKSLSGPHSPRKDSQCLEVHSMQLGFGERQLWWFPSVLQNNITEIRIYKCQKVPLIVQSFHWFDRRIKRGQSLIPLELFYLFLPHDPQASYLLHDQVRQCVQIYKTYWNDWEW